MKLKKLNIPLVRDTIDFKDIKKLIKWLKTNPKLTKGEKTIEFEKKWSNYLGIKYSVFVNSGSSANLAMIYALVLSNRLKNNKIVVPALSWVTTVSPIINFNLEPILCDSEKDYLSLDINHLEEIFKEHNPAVLMLVHPLGFPNDMNTIIKLCDEYDVLLIEDSCETIGTTYNNKLMGTFGLLSSFSFYFGHHMSVSPDTPIPYLDENNNFNLDNIENIYNKYNNDINKIQIMTFDRNNYNISYKKPNAILKHKFNNKKIYKLKLSNGREVDITEDHSVFTYDRFDFNIIEKQGLNIKVGDYVVVPSKTPRPKLKKELNFLEYCKTINDKFFVINYNYNDLTNIKFKWNSKENKQKFNWKKRNVLPLEYQKNETVDLKIAVKNTPRNKYLPIKINIDINFCRLIGYFLAEGSYKKSGIVLSFNINETEYISDVQKIIFDVFGLSTRLVMNEKNNSCNVCVDSETLLIFFRDFLDIKTGAINKQIPKIIFESNDDCIGSFLYGYFAGDGTSMDKRISVTSISKKMINEVSYLFNMLGINGSLVVSNPSKEKCFIKDKKVKKKNIQYKFIVSNIILNKDGDIQYTKNFLNKKLTFPIERYSKRNKSNVTYKCNDYIKLFNTEFSLNDKLNKFIKNNLNVLKVKNIEIINTNYEYVYDFSVPNTENFVGGWQPICLHNSTIEGGMICTDDEELYKIILSIRSHGWDRDLPKDEQNRLRKKYNINDFHALYTFYYPGFNLRSTDLQAFIGISQIDKLDNIGKKRERNLKLYDKYIKNDYWKIKIIPNSFISNFAYPIIHPNMLNIYEDLKNNGVETRPLICGSISKQPFWYDRYGDIEMPFADEIYKNGLYLPNNPTLTKKEIIKICELVNKYTSNLKK